MYQKRSRQNRLIAMLLSFIMILTIFPMPVAALHRSVNDNDDTAIQREITDHTDAEAEESNPNLEEDLLRRDKFTKQYIDPDGNRYAVIFPEQVHYYENNSWVEIDNTLSLEPATKQYVSGNEKFKTRFSQTSDHSQLVSIEDEEYMLS